MRRRVAAAAAFVSGFPFAPLLLLTTEAPCLNLATTAVGMLRECVMSGESDFVLLRLPPNHLGPLRLYLALYLGGVAGGRVTSKENITRAEA